MKKIARPRDLKGINGKDPIGPYDILPYLPYEDCFFDCRHWVYDTVDRPLPFAVTTRISGNCQQYLKIYEQETGGDG